MGNRRSFLVSLGATSLVRAANLPRVAPEVSVAFSDGVTRKLSELRGKIAAVSFISTG